MRRFFWWTLSLSLACGGGQGGRNDGSQGETGLTAWEGAETTGSASDTDPEPGSESDASTGPGQADLPPPVQCGPVGDGPFWLLEGESVEVQVRCSTGLDAPGSDFVFDSLPSGAVYDADDATLRWTPTLDQGAVYELAVTAQPYDEVGTVKIGVADAFDDPENVPVVDPAVYTEEYGLPVLFLDTTPALTDEFYTGATITYRGHGYTAEAKLRGASSLDYPKNSYTLKFAREDKFGDPEVVGGFNGKRKVVLTSTFDDNTYVRQRLSYEVWNRLDPAHVQVQSYSGVVFLDGEYLGLYLILDHVDGFLMEDHGLFQDGNLFKARTHDANFRNTRDDGDPKATLHEGLTKSEGFPVDGQPGAFDDLDELVDFVANSADADFLADIDNRIDRRDYENWWIAVTAISAGDSAGKNSYHYHDPAGGPWRVVPWDFNHSFGQDWRTQRVPPSELPEDYLDRNELFTRFLEAPALGAPLRVRYGEVLDQQLAAVDLLDLVDVWVSENRDSALRDQSKWGDDYVNYDRWNNRSDFLDHDGEVAYLQQWILERWAYLQDIY